MVSTVVGSYCCLREILTQNLKTSVNKFDFDYDAKNKASELPAIEIVTQMNTVSL